MPSRGAGTTRTPSLGVPGRITTRRSQIQTANGIERGIAGTTSIETETETEMGCGIETFATRSGRRCSPASGLPIYETGLAIENGTATATKGERERGKGKGIVQHGEAESRQTRTFRPRAEHAWPAVAREITCHALTTGRSAGPAAMRTLVGNVIGREITIELERTNTETETGKRIEIGRGRGTGPSA